MKEIIIAGIFTVVGAALGFVGALIQSRISAKNNLEIIERQSNNEIMMHRYLEKEKLYSDIIGFIPQLVFSIDYRTRKVNLSNDNKILLNSFKARLSIFSSQEIFNEFYELGEYLCTECDENKRTERIDAFSSKLIKDLR